MSSTKLDCLFHRLRWMLFNIFQHLWFSLTLEFHHTCWHLSWDVKFHFLWSSLTQLHLAEPSADEVWAADVSVANQNVTLWPCRHTEVGLSQLTDRKSLWGSLLSRWGWYGCGGLRGLQRNIHLSETGTTEDGSEKYKCLNCWFL